MFVCTIHIDKELSGQTRKTERLGHWISIYDCQHSTHVLQNLLFPCKFCVCSAIYPSYSQAAQATSLHSSAYVLAIEDISMLAFRDISQGQYQGKKHKKFFLMISIKRDDDSMW